jgi:hypothetical protein
LIINESKKKAESDIYKVNLYINLAMMEEKKQNLKESLKYLDQAYEVDPCNAKVLKFKGRLERILDAISNGNINITDYLQA